MSRVQLTLVVIPLLLGLAWAQLYDHVTITADSLAGQFAPLSDCIENELGLTDTVVTVEAIEASFPGRDMPEKIRNFIRHAYDNWLTMYVLLGGDVEIVPPRYAWADCNNGLEPVPSDLYYSALDGDWDADGDSRFGEVEDSVDLYPDVFVGRCPGTTGASVAIVVDKFVTYVTNPQAPYLSSVFLNGFDLYPWCLAEEAMEYYDSTFVPAAMKPCAKVYDSHTGDHRSAMLALLNDGQHLWIHSDHSNWNCMGAGWTNHGALLYREDFDGLTNQDRLTILMTNGCSAGAFDSTDCIVEHFMLAPNGGGVAAFANTRTGLLDASKPLHGQSFMQLEGLLQVWFGNPKHASLADLALVQAQVAPLAAASARYRWTHYIFALSGDPAMPVWLPSASGAEEGGQPAACGSRLTATVVRGVLRMIGGPSASSGPSWLLDAVGRRVTKLTPGENDVSHLAPGVYFVRARADEWAGASRIVITR